jgi:ribonuclease Z
MLAFSDAGSTVVVDCGGDVIQRIQAAGLDPLSLDALILTHEHPDHVGGFPLFMEKFWLAGREEPVAVYGIEAALGQARRAFETYDTSGWTTMPPIEWHAFGLREDEPVFANDVWQITASPGFHSVPCIGLRVVHRASEAVCAYSCDTRPSEKIAALARGAQLLVHEATGEGFGHSSAAQAAEIARQAQAERLVLVHLPPGPHDESLAEAREVFAHTDIGEELGVYRF